MKANLKPNPVGLLEENIKIYDFNSYFKYISNEADYTNHSIIVSNSPEDFYDSMFKLLKDNAEVKVILIRPWRYDDIKEVSCGSIRKTKTANQLNLTFEQGYTNLVNNFTNRPIVDIQMKRFKDSIPNG